MVMEIRLQPEIVRRLRGDESQGAIAERAGVSRATINRIEMGHAGSITLDTLNAIARALRVDASALVSYAHEPTRGTAKRGAPDGARRL